MSRMTKLRGVAWLRMRAVSTISTMKVDSPSVSRSDAPMRLMENCEVDGEAAKGEP